MRRVIIESPYAGEAMPPSRGSRHPGAPDFWSVPWPEDPRLRGRPASDDAMTIEEIRAALPWRSETPPRGWERVRKGEKPGPGDLSIWPVGLREVSGGECHYPLKGDFPPHDCFLRPIARRNHEKVVATAPLSAEELNREMDKLLEDHRRFAADQQFMVWYDSGTRPVWPEVREAMRGMAADFVDGWSLWNHPTPMQRFFGAYDQRTLRPKTLKQKKREERRYEKDVRRTAGLLMDASRLDRVEGVSARPPRRPHVEVYGADPLGEDVCADAPGVLVGPAKDVTVPWHWGEDADT